MAVERCYLYPFFYKREDSLPIGQNFPQLIFDAIAGCHVGVVILSEEFFTSKWPMMELVAMVDEVEKRKESFKIKPVFLRISPNKTGNVENRSQWRAEWQEMALKDPKHIDVEKWEAALKYLCPANGLVYDG